MRKASTTERRGVVRSLDRGMGKAVTRMASVILGLVLWLSARESADGILFFKTGDSDHNTTPPAGEFAGSGWAFQGKWGVYQGIAIAPRHFITVGHIGGRIEDRFVLGEETYRAIAAYGDADSDLRIWKVDKRFPAFASLYEGTDEIGRQAVILGRGTQRGEAIRVEDRFGEAELKGWRWGDGDRRKRWGVNEVSDIVAAQGDGSGGPGSQESPSQWLKLNFDADGSPEEAHLSWGDSGGALFIKEAGEWKLAGIHRGVSGPYSETGEGEGFNAAVFDEGGLYTGGEGNWSRVEDRLSDRPGALFAVRIGSRRDWIAGVLAGEHDPEPPEVQMSEHPQGPYKASSDAQIDPQSQTIEIPLGDTGETSIAFIRLQSEVSIRITSVALRGSVLSLSYAILTRLN